MPILPATYTLADDGTPYSDAFDDVYHSAAGAIGQANHVFLGGNGLPERWRGRERFVIVETGFGLGVNFLATWAAWRADPERSASLHFVSCELHPFTVDDLVALHARWPEFAHLASELHTAWPGPIPGVHRLHLDSNRVFLTLHFGDARDGLAQLDCRADAFMLDGFSPSCNPELWSPKVFHLLGRMAATDASLATWSVAGEVREGLRRAGFEVERVPGFAGKRQMLRGRYSASRPRPDMPSATTAARQDPAARRAIVIGAGVAGSAVAERLAARGWTVDVVDAADRPGQGASGNHAGVLRPLPSLDDNRMSRLTRAGTLYGWRHVRRLRQAGLSVRAEACGVLHLARDAAQEAKMRAVAERLSLPSGLLRFVDADEASRIGGWPVPLGGWWFADSGWVQPPSLCEANLAAHPEHIRPHFGRHVAALEYEDGNWLAADADAKPIASAPVLILAAGTGLARFAHAAALPVVSARGQVSLLAAETGSAPRVVMCRMGYVSPAVDGLRCAGATFDVDDDDTQLRERDHRENLEKLEAMLPGYTEGIYSEHLAGRVGFRPASPDRLPMIGAVPAVDSVAPGTPLEDIPRQPGLYALSGFGARGLVWASLAGELLAARINGEPLPIERDLATAVDPARFLLRRVRITGMDE
ncbi:bifunctional tRNA (5-methylaminomethyl-2-thiouridine)(34)-methyltransferase MnmD/FAD-dependent 5-carboxymethylaminomethyl-2-thiouridine(34) oxidoreductase MnmC [Azoarcus sp. L1K30]|uniref:bifunctional tRNA (5-methylaminomethyl-2-thiouridine)(34)-methyltransferase MnmD/FAD-dependent 5-carboxymethylaminomethyl-2-thiouridine(34) oxidoreductase MnmC n=1 Tax=Azoarcus sp. L1K30 TaxID=2820277 RepID=UPI001B81A66D|nr:bifunctional tRNA (5-methylaminomethyl-2-thiouridine)(34)-methyltransferase MnmD/FAD-dependent 5-carboxymethylaminomethyl-2-thiouridine(34) oxidoreductase MnmC [Azoarcus sp. L1K30]MBR0565069.1 bifunctional tRNA (5-methylaminomethyl-2-thiouridine)(34)-methyltransferase MnmD/FAD-dependent 5-carboxymethylaminomethyl-2-thiouridine(34) oxidoreductase MnmC [Azoarcus sp. L1K30]